MSKLLAWKTVASIRPEGCNGVESGQSAAVMEGTTGRMVSTLPRVWAAAETEEAERTVPQPELAFYRKYTEAMLHRYLRMSMEAGRVPSLLGRSLFRGNVTSYRVKSFEDVVIFCYDVERCLSELDAGEQELIKRIALQEYTQGEAASLMGMSLRSCIRRYGAAVDHLTAVFLRLRLLEPLIACQGQR
ncbi:hypothetical protein SAMN05421819_2141 [Bryocella elongata]|uniref:Sigma-70, region 4 n=1 Tax=Bryocella elongata TaxID=863522 RepID=A0A1H5Y653_9BACT|nr:sigma-70 family RNA polymerase sigma factor [Bryocella elongata]SEG19418.1 hypothetical protein SAMN05421819_2141 [Bryocella elongata]